MTNIKEAIEANPELETIKIKYHPGGGEANIVIVDGKNLGDLLTDVSVSFSVNEIPQVLLTLAPLCCELDVDGTVVFDTTKVPDKIARKIYDALKARFENS